MLFQKLLCPIRLRLTEPRVTFSLNFFPSRCALQRKSINVNKSKRLQDLNLTFMTEKLSRIMRSLFFSSGPVIIIVVEDKFVMEKVGEFGTRQRKSTNTNFFSCKMYQVELQPSSVIFQFYEKTVLESPLK